MEKSKKQQQLEQEYQQRVKELSPNSHIVRDCFRAFLVGGIICALGQIITNLLDVYGLSRNEMGMYTSMILIFIASLLTGLGIYQKIGRFAGAGSIVPITGFSNSVTSPALEFKKEGFILGLGAKIFIVAGPVILYGTLTSVLVGLVYYFVK
nr:stage V sporulation protein AC [uncultured Tyzzerella sp.]